MLPKPERTSGRRRYSEEVLHRLAIIDVAQRAGFTLDDIRHLTGPMNRGARAGERIRELAEQKLPDIETLIDRAEAMKAWLEVATTCDCETVDVCSLFTDPAPDSRIPTGSVRASGSACGGRARGTAGTHAHGPSRDER